MKLPEEQTTQIAISTEDDVWIRGRSLCSELIGQVSFTQMAYFQIVGQMPNDAQTAVLDACLVTLMEHGLTPSALATRLVYTSAPEAMQGAVAAGLLGVGSLFVGTVEGCATLLREIVDADDSTEAAAARIAERHRVERAALPGFGHPQHRPDDPRTPRLYKVAKDHGLAGAHFEALLALGRAVDKSYAKHITINATGAVAAALGDAGVPTEIMRGFAILARCAGLIGHIHEEQARPAMGAIWKGAERAVTYQTPRQVTGSDDSDAG